MPFSRKEPAEIVMSITWIHETPELLKATASVKARYPLWWRMLGSRLRRK